MKSSGLIVVFLAVLGMAAPSAQDASVDARRRNLDEVLDLYVRDGLVYYKALKGDRRLLDGYVSALGGVSLASAGRAEQMAFWLNAYNALVLRTVIDNYPTAKRSNEYPARSIRQIPGAFETMKHQVAGRSLTLDQIEQTVLPGFSDPRLFLALGRGAVGSGRLRSEAFDPETIEKQLGEAAGECATHAQCLVIDRSANKMAVSSVFSWRSKEFASAYADKAPPSFSMRSPIERAVLAFVEPRLTAIEKDFLSKNDFKVEFSTFDWSLNDLTGR
jgi:uncharacterized protein DUF547